MKSSSGQTTPAATPVEAYIKEEVKRQVDQIKEELMRKDRDEVQAIKQVQDVLTRNIEEVKLTLSSIEKQLGTTCGRCHQGTTNEPAGWSFWGSWTPCSSSCGSGTRARSRTCNSPTKQGTCQGVAEETQQCQGHNCTVWGPWQSWSQCNGEFGEGTISRSRTCLGGTRCHGSKTEKKICAAWLSWSQWSSCTASCDIGSRYRSRKCSSDTDPDMFAGLCEGRNSESENCLLLECLWSDYEPESKALHRLSQPVLELNLTRTSPHLTRIWSIAALPGGEAVIYNYASGNNPMQVIKINGRGLPVQHLYSCVSCNLIRGLLVLGEDVFIIHPNGTVVRVNHQDGRVVRVYHIQNVSNVNHYGSLSSNPALIVDKDLLLLVDYNKGEVFTYRLSTEQKVVRLTGMSRPQSVSYLYTQQAVYYVVCQTGSDTVSVYNSSWSRVSTMGTSSNITLSHPTAAITSLEQTILVADYSNNRIIEFSKEGEFMRHLISVRYSWLLSVSFPHLWVVDGNGKLQRYRIYKT